MTEIDYNGIKVRMPDEWSEVTLKQYLEFSKVSETIDPEDESISNILKTYKLVEILTGMTEEEMDELQISDMNDLSLKMSYFINKFNFESEPSDHFTIDGVDYVAKNVNELDNGEYISLNILREQYNDSYELFPRMLAVLIRPGKMEYDRESKKEIWTPEPFNRKDILNLELRKEILMTKAKAKDVVPILNFFLNMIKK